MELVHVGRELRIRKPVDHLAVLDDVVAVGHRRGEAEILLDEPMAGMGHEDIDKIAALIKRISAKYTILMVEHNLSVVANLSDIITVLTRGKVLAEGHYTELTKDERVKEAYLGAGHG